MTPKNDAFPFDSASLLKLARMAKKIEQGKEEKYFSLENLTGYLREAKIELNFDVILHEVFATQGGKRIDVNDVALDMFFRMFEGGYKHTTKKIIEDALAYLASVNRVNRWLDAIPAWDGRPRYNKFIKTILAAENTAIVRKWFDGLVGMQVYRDQCETSPVKWRPPMLVLIGEQGHGKNWVFEQLGLGIPGIVRDGFSWDSVIGEDRDAIRRLKRALIVTFDENPTAIGREQESVKSLLTRTHISTRGILEKFDSVDTATVTSYGGTTNKKNVLVDSTGSRRFACLDVTKKRWIAHFDFPQLLAELVESLPAWDGKDTPCWASTREDARLESNKRFDASEQLFDEDLRDAYKQAGVKNLRGILDNIERTEAYRHFTKDPYTLARRLSDLYERDAEGFYSEKV